VILADTSVWIDHLRSGDAALARLLDAGQVLVHPFIVGELALGNLRQRSAILSSLQDLPATRIASDAEVLGFIERHKLYGLGIGYVDAHLMAAVKLTPGTGLWTRDKRLLAAAAKLKLAASNVH
jgi:hypothetical protein